MRECEINNVIDLVYSQGDSNMKRLYNDEMQYVDNSIINQLNKELETSLLPIVLKYCDMGYTETDLMFFIEENIRYNLTCHRLKNKLSKLEGE